MAYMSFSESEVGGERPVKGVLASAMVWHRWRWRRHLSTSWERKLHARHVKVLELGMPRIGFDGLQRWGVRPAATLEGMCCPQKMQWPGMGGGSLRVRDLVM